MARSSADVEREVEATRGQIDQTVEALKEKMQPRELLEEATRAMGGAGNKVLTTVVEQARENPIPIALIGAGVAWLALSQARRRRGYDPYTGAGYYETYEGYDENNRPTGRLKARVSGAVEAAKDRLAGARERVSGAAAHAGEGAAEGASEVRGRAARLADTARTRAGEAGRQAQTRFQETLDTEPLILGAIGLAVGAAIGASLPATRVENRYVGPVRDRMMARGQAAARASYEDAKAAAQRAYSEVKADTLARAEGEATAH